MVSEDRVRGLRLPTVANRDEKEDRAKLKALRSAIQAGEESGIAGGDVFAEVRDSIRQVAPEKEKVA